MGGNACFRAGIPVIRQAMTMEKRDGLIRLLACLSGVLLCLLWLCMLLDGLGSDQPLMLNLMERYAPSPRTGLPSEEYAGMCRMITDYLSGARDTFQYRFTTRGLTYEAFQKHEIRHMEDVRALFLLERRVLLACAALVAVSGLWLVKRRRTTASLRGLRDSGLLILALLASLGILAAADFGTFFTGFHELFFTNDLWLLNPRTDLLIRLMPTPFFMTYARILLVTFLPVPVCLLAVPALILRGRSRDKRAKDSRRVSRGDPQSHGEAQRERNDTDSLSGDIL